MERFCTFNKALVYPFTSFYILLRDPFTRYYVTQGSSSCNRSHWITHHHSVVDSYDSYSLSVLPAYQSGKMAPCKAQSGARDPTGSCRESVALQFRKRMQAVQTQDSGCTSKHIVYVAECCTMLRVIEKKLM